MIIDEMSDAGKEESMNLSGKGRLNRWDQNAGARQSDSENDTENSSDSSKMPRASTQGIPNLMGLNTFPAAAAAAVPAKAEEIWVENKTGDGRVYYYNARTRESSWTKPVAGAGVKVITQEEVEKMADGPESKPATANEFANGNGIEKTSGEHEMRVALGGDPTKAAMDLGAGDKAAAASLAGVPPFGFPPGAPPPFGFPPGGPPPFGFPPFVPPPGAFPPGVPPFVPPFGAPFGVPPFGMMPFGGPMGFPPFNPLGIDETRYFYTDETKKQIKAVQDDIAKIKEEASVFTEHESPDGKKYYFNTKTNQSTWDKPKCLDDLQKLEAKLEQLKKVRVEKTFESHKPLAAAAKGETKEAEMSEEEKAKQKSKPISSTQVPGTPWCVVWTKDKRVFFYNASEKVSLWERPPSLQGRVDVDRMVKECPAGAGATADTSAAKKKQPASETNAEPPTKKSKNGVTDEDETSQGSTSPKSGSNSPRNERSQSPVGNGQASNSASPARQVADEFLQKEKIEASKEAAMEAEHKAAQVRAQLPLEQRMQQFKEMLIEKEVSAYSTWEKELQKIVFDPRYLLLTSKERKQVFEKYMKDRANEESKEKAAALKRKKDDYFELLKEANVTLKSGVSFNDFKAKYMSDERFKAIEKSKDRESFFNDYLSELRRQEKEDKYADKEKLKKNYIAMLKELKHLHRHSSWTETKRLLESDPRYRAIESSTKREDYFRDYCKYLDEKSSSSSTHNGDSKSSSSSGKDRHRDRDRDRDRESKSESSRKMDYEESDRGGKENGGGGESEREEGEEDETVDEDAKRREREKQERIEASLRSRNQEVREQLSKIKSETEKERDQLRRDEALECFKALLIDLIKPNMTSSKDHHRDKDKDKEKDKEKDKDGSHSKSSSKSDSKSSEIGWKEAKKILKKDARWSYCKVLEKEQKEQLFEEHMNKFRAKKRELFYQLLDETTGVTLISTWKEAKKLIKSDSRYEKLQQAESFKMEKEFESYLANKLQKAKQDFKDLLLQTKLISYKTFATLKESPGHIKEIEDLLAKDKGWIVLECVADERKKLLLEYVEKLHNEGPPPPPTATEPPARRK